MQIGELSKQTRVSPRLLRYYEQQGLLIFGSAIQRLPRLRRRQRSMWFAGSDSLGRWPEL
ncbi:MAG: MerR family DNA-binding transcriptional regulator [Nocardioidaceae bacterium]